MFLTPQLEDSLTEASFDGTGPAYAKFPEYLAKTGWRNPTDKDKTAWMYGTGHDQHYFTWILSPGNERHAEAFHNHMKFKTLAKKWFETVPVKEIFADFKKDDPDAVLMVDVGGNSGHDTLDFHRAWPDQPGRLIVEDLPAVIQTIDREALKPVEAVEHDFFTPQPVKGAKAYYLKMVRVQHPLKGLTDARQVLHDWPESSAREILANLKPALERGYSKILINEIVVPDCGAGWFSTSVDLIMMTMLAAHERRENQWRALIESVGGLKLSKIWNCGAAPERLIEVELE